MIRKIYETKSVVGESGTIHELAQEVDPEEGQFLFDLIERDSTIRTTLEVGCAHGLSSLHICLALKDRPGASHTLIDPGQTAYWDGVGRANLREAGVDFFTFIELKSEVALPQLLAEGEGTFDFVFIDGWHTFDQAMLDCFYATRLLRVGGYLALDDVNWASIRRAVDFYSGYPCYQPVGSVGEARKRWRTIRLVRALVRPVSRDTWGRLLSRPVYRRVFDDDYPRMIALRKTSEDERRWDWHYDTF